MNESLGCCTVLVQSIFFLRSRQTAIAVDTHTLTHTHTYTYTHTYTHTHTHTHTHTSGDRCRFMASMFREKTSWQRNGLHLLNRQCFICTNYHRQCMKMKPDRHNKLRFRYKHKALFTTSFGFGYWDDSEICVLRPPHGPTKSGLI